MIASTMIVELTRAAIVSTSFLVIFALAEAWRAWRNPPVEWTRKLVHFLGGLTSATFPWLFTSAWIVLGLGASFFLILWGTRRMGWLQSVHGVTRRSEGGLYFPVAVFLLFVVGAERPVFYLISILVLVVSDAVAAVLGSAYGRVGYAVEHDRRTVEGSTVFFFSTFLIVHLPLLLMARTDPLVSVLTAAQLALIVTLLEGICVRGNDNLVVPLATYFVLLKLTKEPAAFLIYQSGSMLVMIGVIAFLARRIQFLSASGAMALILFFYGAFALGGEEWVVAPALVLVAFCVFHLVRVRPVGRETREHQVVATFYMAAVPTALFLTNNAFETMVPHAGRLDGGDPFFALYIGAVAAQMALFLRHQEWEVVKSRWAGSLVISAGVTAAAWIAVTPLGLRAGTDGITTHGLLVASTVLVGSVIVYEVALRSGRWPTHAPWIARLQAVSALVAVALTVPWALP